jgi:cytochrome d ubiquinol oxidase subunit I
MYLRTGDGKYHKMTKFWTRVFAVNFAMGVATGIVMEFQFGTNWAAFSRYVGDVFDSALAAEGIFAFFLESGFLVVLVFCWDRVGRCRRAKNRLPSKTCSTRQRRTSRPAATR